MVVFRTVKDANDHISRVIGNDNALSSCEVHGEISEYSRNQRSGHAYFTIKDANSVLSCAMFNSDVSRNLHFKPEGGQAVVCYGRINMYVPTGKVQMVVNRMEMEGAGEQQRLYEELKRRLTAEGIFDPAIKKPLVQFPQKVGIVTSPTGQAIRDIMSVAKLRNPYVQLILYPALVEGDGAPETIARGIEILDSMDVDTIIIGRGGGQKEGQRAFNDERVVRAVYNAVTPIISAVGHAGNRSLTDDAADVYAITPTEAATFAIPNVMDKIRQLCDYENTMKNYMRNRLTNVNLRLSNYRSNLDRLNPVRKLQDQMQRLDILTNSMNVALNNKMSSKKHLLEMYNAKLNGLSPERKLIERKQTYDVLLNSLKLAMDNRFHNAKHLAEMYTTRLHGLSPTAKLVGGFGYIEKQDDKNPLRSVKDTEVGKDLDIVLSDGRVSATVTKIVESSD